MITRDIDQLAQNVYKSIRKEVTGNEPINLLHIGQEFSFIASGTENVSTENCWILDIGSDKTAQNFFKHQPPSPAEVENAIQVVEDEVMPINKLLTNKSNLFTTDAGIREIALLTQHTQNKLGIVLQRSDMEQLFNRLAAIINGQPASQDKLPADNEFSARLLILREVMHHLGFAEILITERKDEIIAKRNEIHGSK